MLHGANGSAEELEPWRLALVPEFRALSVNLLGHGGRPLPDTFETRDFAADLITRLDEAGIARAIVFGYSFGGVLALYLARHYPERVSGVVTLASKVSFDRRSVRQLTWLLQVPRLEAKPLRKAHLSRVHQPNDWRDLVVRLNALFREYEMHPPMSADDLRSISCPVLVISGEHDALVGAEDARALRDALRHADAVIAPGPLHPPGVVRPEGLAEAISAWARDPLPR